VCLFTGQHNVQTACKLILLRGKIRGKDVMKEQDGENLRICPQYKLKTMAAGVAKPIINSNGQKC
jgi:hypothetical protein